MKTAYLVCLVYILISCSTNEHKNVSDNRKAENVVSQEDILGIWADGTSENASFAIYEDSLYNVEHFVSTYYELRNDTLRLFYDDFKTYSIVEKPHYDTLVFIDDSVRSTFWRFKD